MAQWVESIQWMESILCQVGDDSAKLYILLTGPAGTSVLSGTTFSGTVVSMAQPCVVHLGSI